MRASYRAIIDAMAADAFVLDPSITFLNHGSFGACPRAVLEAQARLRARLESDPVRFFTRELEGLLDGVRVALGAFVGADPDDLALMPNATHAVSTVARSLRLEPGDELVVTDHAYNACRNALAEVAARSGARVVVAHVPFPIRAPAEVTGAVLAVCGARTRLVLVDHVTSPTGLVFPVAEIVAALAARGVDTLVDGAHAPGMLPLELRALGAAYYTGNCHKWLCAPKGAAFLHVRRDRQEPMMPLAIGHGWNSPRRDRSRFRLLFDWIGTADPTALLCVPVAIDVLAGLVPGGWPEVRAKNRALALAGRRLLCDALGVAAPCPDEMIGTLATVPIADGVGPQPEVGPDPLQETLFREHAIEVPIVWFPAWPRRGVRISAQLYNRIEQYDQLARVIVAGYAPSA